MGRRPVLEHRRSRSVAVRAVVRCSRSPKAGSAADGREVVSYASNDYLGLTQHPAVKAAAIDAVERWGTGSGAARLVVGSRPVHHELERELADWRGTEAALLFPTGFTAEPLGHHHLRHPGRAHPLRRAQPRLDHRRVPHGPGRDRDLPPRRRRAPGLPARPGPGRRRRPHHDRHRHGVLDGRRPCAARRHRRPGPSARLAARARRGPRRARPVAGRSRGPRRGRRPAGGHALEDARLARRVHRRPAPVRRPHDQRRSAVHLHHGLQPGRRGGRAGRGAASCARPRATSCGRGCGPTSTGSPRATRRR